VNPPGLNQLARHEAPNVLPGLSTGPIPSTKMLLRAREAPGVGQPVLTTPGRACQARGGGELTRGAPLSCRISQGGSES
jgi:hypothetical protein